MYTKDVPNLKGISQLFICKFIYFLYIFTTQTLRDDFYEICYSLALLWVMNNTIFSFTIETET